MGPRLGRAARGFPVAGLAGRAGRIRRRGLPVDTVLRLRRLHRIRHRAHRRLGHPAGWRQPGHRAGSRHRRHRPRHAPPDPFWERKWSCGNQFRAKNRSGAMRLRVRFSKLGKIRWTSHRDVARMWERAFRRTALPLAYTQGFSPRPRVSFGLALPTGHESVAEYLDLELAVGAELDEVGVSTLPARLSPALPA